MHIDTEIKVTASSLYINVKPECQSPWALRLPTFKELAAFVPAGKALELFCEDGNLMRYDTTSKPTRCLTRFNLVSASQQEKIIAGLTDSEKQIALAEEIHSEWMRLELQSYIAKHYEDAGRSAGARKGFINGMLVGATIAVGAYFIYKGRSAA